MAGFLLELLAWSVKDHWHSSSISQSLMPLSSELTVPSDQRLAAQKSVEQVEGLVLGICGIDEGIEVLLKGCYVCEDERPAVRDHTEALRVWISRTKLANLAALDVGRGLVSNEDPVWRLN